MDDIINSSKSIVDKEILSGAKEKDNINKSNNNENKDNKKNNINDLNVEVVKNKTIDFISKLGFFKKDFEDIDSLSLKRGFIFGLTKDNTDYILKYQPNKSTVELLLNCYLKSLNISKSFLIPESFFINNDNSYFYIIEKYDTDLYKYFNILDEKKIILSFKELLNIILFIVNSIVDLHKNNIIHADLKLENVILNVDENTKYKDLKIIDFDVGVFNKIPNSLNNLPERYNKILNNKKPRGTRIYMLKDTEMSFKNDIFSLGVIAIVLLYKNTKLLLSYRKSVDSKNIIKKLTDFRTNIEDNKSKLDMIMVIEKYLKKEYKKEVKKINYKNNLKKSTNFIDFNVDIINLMETKKSVDKELLTDFKINNEQYNEKLCFFRGTYYHDKSAKL
jgi:serine/threonine protein kinase